MNYFSRIQELLQTVEANESEAMNKAAKRIAYSIKQDGIVHLFGCGHSHILTEETFYRAGGLVPIHPILHEPLMLHEGAIQSSTLERKNNYAEQFMNEQGIQSGDVMIVFSTSGRNPVPVDVALVAKEKGAYVIGVTSITYAESQPSRHVNGKYLHEVVNTVIDNHAPTGDAVLSHSKVAVNYGPVSTAIGATIINNVLAESITILAEENIDPPVFLSGNLEGADQHNQELINKYKDRIKF
ncbi:SIS domain-containing protein [Virgibacillus necropolis]|uniref:SIS domain-containing protein n=1 Tax=Virgibacillus necropolis TaxID=163877 RepID=UPI00384B81A0